MFKKYREREGNSKLRLAFCCLIMLVEIYLVFAVIDRLNEDSVYFSIATRVIAFFAVLRIYSKNITSSMKMPWIILILLFPVQGITLYIMTGGSGKRRKMKERYEAIDSKLLPILPKNDDVLSDLNKDYSQAGNISNYIVRNSSYPVYKNTDVTYHDDGKVGIDAQIEDLEKAEKFIFMEYHAIENKVYWKKIQDVLERKVKQGVEVRVFYDDMGSIGFINMEFVNRLKSVGIKCRVFNPFVPGLNFFLNNRDHRKITVIDGKVGYTGGYNIADRYFHLEEPYGKWKDTGIRLEGDAVKSLTVTFLEMWNAVRNDDADDKDFAKYLPDYDYRAKQRGYIQPYRDSPMDNEQVGEEVYISILNKAEKYCYFTTPYLIITDEMRHSMTLAAKRGVDVRIVTPGIPDKKMVYSVTRSFYNGLVKDGVKIYEWRPGFLHAKLCVADDVMATCGTINLDYRSLYHHFENGCFMVGCDAVTDIKNDILGMIAESEDVTEEYKVRKIPLRMGQMFLRFFAELL